MNPFFQRLMRSATRLVGRGDLKAATAAIQQALAGKPESPPPASSAQVHPHADVIDVAARVIEPAVVEPPVYEPPPMHEAPSPEPRPETDALSLPDEQFIAGRYIGAGGQREYKLYIPPHDGTRTLPLIVMLHGCTQDADDFAAGTAMNDLARMHGFLVLYPEQSPRFNPNRCWNWFKHNHQARDRGEPALIAGMTRQVMAQHAIDPARVYAAGLSAGGAMAAILGDAYPDLFAAVGVHSGLPTGAAKDVASAFGAMKKAPQIVPATRNGVPTIVFHGDTDATVDPANGRHVIAASVHASAQVETQTGVAAGGLRYTRELHRADGGPVTAEHWVVHGSPHAWSGGNSAGSYTDPRGPNASAEMVRFFMEHVREPVH
ncbi:PHB depolymerase family esterase [Ramlibacter sp. WS9]|uniref:extracellular catalytic domain type 1 short-chain-length polyhydroxyalkanoate depolymerase n=1 Tax=Ramlibacter sp. WS9 TaxID=1882741 RepID=UPI00114175B4|nr:PHB depolymerase family esterase [Ramlibacter sp. WS9]ROZ72483.1 poly(3-hydroxyalkanoate) depolymerase [Ramlibacter sp. WS9]